MWSRIKPLETTVLPVLVSVMEFLENNITVTVGNNCTHNISSSEVLSATICSQCERGGFLLKTACSTGTNSLDQSWNKTFKGQ